MSVDYFAFHILHSGQQDISQLFATTDVDKFSSLEIEKGIHDLPLLTDYSARFECQITSRYKAGDHDILVSEVLSMKKKDRKPLIYYQGKYENLAR